MAKIPEHVFMLFQGYKTNMTTKNVFLSRKYNYISTDYLLRRRLHRIMALLIVANLEILNTVVYNLKERLVIVELQTGKRFNIFVNQCYYILWSISIQKKTCLMPFLPKKKLIETKILFQLFVNTQNK